MLALKKKREAEAKAKAEAEAAAAAQSPPSGQDAVMGEATTATAANGDGGKVSLLGIGGKKKKKENGTGGGGKKRSPGEIRIQKGQ